MMNIKIIFGMASLVIGFVAYIFYYQSIFTKKHKPTRPHIFSWFAWSISVSFAFFAQIKNGGGFGVWITGFSALNCVIITAIALSRGKKNILWTDWVCFIAAVIGIIYWYFTDGLIIPIIIIALSDIIAFIPTYRRNWIYPDEDTPLPWALHSLKYFLALFALQSYSVATYLFPAVLFLDNALCAAIILYRRQYIHASLT